MSDTNEPAGVDLRQQFETTLSSKDREIALLQAGIDTKDPLGKMFVTGDISIEDATAAWNRAQASAAPAPVETPPAADPPTPAATTAPTTPAPSTPPADVALFDEAGNLIAGGAIPGGDNGPDPSQAAVDTYWKAMREGKRDRDAEAMGFDVLFNAAAKGDPRVLVPGGRKGSDS